MQPKRTIEKSDNWIGFRLEGTIIKGNTINHETETNPDIINAMRRLSMEMRYRIKVLTHRADSQRGREEVRLFLVKHRIPAEEITHKIDNKTLFIVDLKAEKLTSTLAKPHT